MVAQGNALAQRAGNPLANPLPARYKLPDNKCFEDERGAKQNYQASKKRRRSKAEKLVVPQCPQKKRRTTSEIARAPARLN